MVNAFFYSNIAVQTTLSGSITSSATSATVAATTGWPTSFPFVVAIDFGAANEELVSVTNNVANTLTIVRGFGGTSAVSHSTAAVVRHVFNAQDATDARTHEAATGAVHGLTGSIVGTTDTQTLTNKTLTAPAVSNPTVTGGGSLAGTFTGAPTFTGGPVFTTTSVRFTRDFATDIALRTSVSGDGFDRFQLRPDGRHLWGSGTATQDTILYREDANTLATDNSFLRVYRASAGSNALAIRVTGDTASRLFINADGSLHWGPGGAASADTDLYRASAGVLATDNIFDAQVETETTGLVAATDFTTTTFEARRTCNIATVHVALSYTGATITATSAGNIGDTLCCTLPAGYRPPYFTTAMFDKSGVANGGLAIGTDGTCTLKSLSPTATIASGASIDFYATFVL